jgi:excisionase family DNA binding protein
MTEPEEQQGADTWTTEEAARVLRVSRRRVQQLLQSGEIEGERRGGQWFAFQHSVNRYLREHGPGSPRVSGIGRQRPPESSESAREARQRVEDLARELGRLEGRLELTERAESTIRAERDRLALQLEEERQERRRERERADRLRDELEAARLELARAGRGEEPVPTLDTSQEPPGGPVAAAETSEGIETAPAPVGPQKPSSRPPWWRRLLTGS